MCMYELGVNVLWWIYICDEICGEVVVENVVLWSWEWFCVIVVGALFDIRIY